MGLAYRHLDERTRALMVEEIDRDIAAGTLYVSDNLSPRGQTQYPDLLRTAAGQGTDDSLAAAIRSLLNPFEKPRQLKSGKLSKPPRMRSNAHEMLAEGEFNRFYIRALCRRVLDDGGDEIVVFRAKQVHDPRPESEAMIGNRIRAEELLRDLRTHPGVDTALGLPPGPNSGLSAHIP